MRTPAAVVAEPFNGPNRGFGQDGFHVEFCSRSSQHRTSGAVF